MRIWQLTSQWSQWKLDESNHDRYKKEKQISCHTRLLKLVVLASFLALLATLTVCPVYILKLRPIKSH